MTNEEGETYNLLHTEYRKFVLRLNKNIFFFDPSKKCQSSWGNFSTLTAKDKIEKIIPIEYEYSLILGYMKSFNDLRLQTIDHKFWQQ